MDYYNIISNEYIEALNMPVILSCVKVEFLDNNYNAYQQITLDLSRSGGNISASYKQGVRRTVSLTLFDPDGTYIPNPNNRYFWIGRKFKIYTGIRITKHKNNYSTLYYTTDNAQDDDFYWFPQGVFVLTTIEASHSLSNRQITISGVDKFGLFTSDTGACEMIGDFTIPVGMTVYNALISILHQDMQNGEILDSTTPIIDKKYSNIRIPYELTKGAGSYLGDIIIELATTFRAEVYYDVEGHLVFKPLMEGDQLITTPIVWKFFDVKRDYLSSTLNYDLANVVNTIYVVGDNPNAKVPIVAFLKNTNPASPTNVQKIGARSRLYTSSVIKTIQEAKDYAAYMMHQVSRIQQSLNLTTSFIPHIDLNQRISLTDDFYKEEISEYIIQSISYTFGDGKMSLSTVKFSELPTY